MKKTVVEYITDTLEDIPKQSLQTNKRRLHAFFSEQETIEKRGAHFVFRNAFYSVEKLRRPTKQSLFKEYKMLCSDLKSTPSGEISDMEYKDVVLYGNTSSPVVQERLTEYLERNCLFVMKKPQNVKQEKILPMQNCRKHCFIVKGRSICFCSFQFVS